MSFHCAIRLLLAAGLVTATITSVHSASLTSTRRVPDACSLMSRLEVERAAGFAVNEGAARIRTGAVTGCLFSAGHGERVMIVVRRISPGDPWKQDQIARMSGATRFGAYREAAIIGDRSFLYATGRDTVLCVFSGEHYVQVSLSRPYVSDGAPAVLEQLARGMLARLLLD